MYYKKAFTLIEVLISTILISLIVLFVTSAILENKKSINILDTNLKVINKNIKIAKILYEDLIQSSKVDIKYDKDFSILYIKSLNTLYNIDNPYIVWLVLKNKNSLIRLESPQEIKLPVQEENEVYIYSDKIKEKCKYFLIEKAKKSKKVLVYIKFENDDPILFEVDRI